ncbi:MAG TPA: hypothetical protein VLT83_06990 [Opitutaceae bacterium]|nr:hypothetical protein [Opitutaceae bacterium]
MKNLAMLLVGGAPAARSPAQERLVLAMVPRALTYPSLERPCPAVKWLRSSLAGNPVRLLLAVAALVLASCSTVSPQQRVALDDARNRYAGVTFEMTREELVQLLGAPKKSDATHLMWEVRYGPDNFETLRVEFNSENQVAVIERQHSRFVWNEQSTIVSLDGSISSTRPPESGHPQTSRDVVYRSGRQSHQMQGGPALDPGMLQSAQAEFTLWTASFSHWWTVFEDACLAGNVEQVARMCDGQVLAHLSPNSLQDLLGRDWKAERMRTRYKKVIAPSLSHRAAARVEFELTEHGTKHIETMWWVLSERGWKCLNLPFQAGQLPPEIKSPPPAWD